MHNAPYFAQQSIPVTNPAYYEQKANQLRIQNQILKRRLDSQNVQNTKYFKEYSPQNQYIDYTEPTFSPLPPQQIPQRTVIYRQVGEPIITQRYRTSPPQRHDDRIYQQPQRLRTQSYNIIPSGLNYDLRQRKKRLYIDQVEQEIIDLQTRGYKLEREANRLSSFIKQDLRDFVRDSNIHKQCSFKHKYLKSIANRPRHFRFNF